VAEIPESRIADITNPETKGTKIMNNQFETPTAVKHDSTTLADEVRVLLEATADLADEKVSEARKRLEAALSDSRPALQRVREKALQSAKVADEAVRRHPYETVAAAFGIGALIGCLIARR
jgi:ElaB/YqjD/DUF883 family membrane-anchored ribosome-binding protein